MFRRTDFLWALPISALLALSGTNPAWSDFSQSILEPVSQHVASETQRGTLGLVRKIEEAVLPFAKTIFDTAQELDQQEAFSTLQTHTQRAGFGLFSVYETKLEQCHSTFVGALGTFWPVGDGCGLEDLAKGGTR